MAIDVGLSTTGGAGWITATGRGLGGAGTASSFNGTAGAMVANVNEVRARGRRSTASARVNATAPTTHIRCRPTLSATPGARKADGCSSSGTSPGRPVTLPINELVVITVDQQAYGQFSPGVEGKSIATAVPSVAA